MPPSIAYAAGQCAHGFPFPMRQPARVPRPSSTTRDSPIRAPRLRAVRRSGRSAKPSTRSPPDQRAAIVLVDLEGWSVEEAARALDCPIGTVKSRCFRGRAKLAERLAHLRNPDAPGAVVHPDNGAVTTDGEGGAP